MAGKVRHFKERNGRYSARIVVPKHLRTIIGKAELETQLGGDRREALRNHAAAVAELQACITAAEQRANGGEQMPARFPMSVQEIAVENYRSKLAFDLEIRENDPAFANMDIDPDDIAELRAGLAGKLTDDALDHLVGYRIERFRSRGNTDAAKGTPEWRALAMALCASELEALARYAERNEGDFSGKPEHPTIAGALACEDRPEPVSLRGLFDAYVKVLEREGKGREARRRWTPVFENLVAFLKHDDATRLADDDLIRWRDKLLETLASKTVGDVYLASVRAVLNWAVENKRLSANPAAGVKVRKAKRVRTREKGYRDDEALAILKACRGYQPAKRDNPANREKPQTTAAKRWASLLCAFTGSRISEITQLRKQDVRREGDVAVIRITPEAGSVKSGNYRDVPLHRQLIDLGFLDFVDAAPAGALFHAAKPDKALQGARTSAGRVSEWLQSLKLVPDGVQPNHAWRHRFKTIGRELELSDRVLDAIQGHAGRTAGDAYGDVTIAAKKKAIDRFPRYPGLR